MTTIAYKYPYLCCDSASWTHDVLVGKAAKIYPGNDFLLSACGNKGWGLPFIRWSLGETEEKPKNDKEEGFRALKVYPDGRVETADQYLEWFPIEAEFFALGSGFELAMGAFAMGATAMRAVEVACQFDANSRLPVETWDVRTGQRVESLDQAA